MRPSADTTLACPYLLEHVHDATRLRTTSEMADISNSQIQSHSRSAATSTSFWDHFLRIFPLCCPTRAVVSERVLSDRVQYADRVLIGACNPICAVTVIVM